MIPQCLDGPIPAAKLSEETAPPHTPRIKADTLVKFVRMQSKRSSK
jgi:hypothetical protein